MFNAAVEGLTADAGQRRPSSTVFEGQGPLALVITPEAIEGGEAAVTGMLWKRLRPVAVTARAAQAALEWPYADFGAAGPADQPPRDRRDRRDRGHLRQRRTA